jgi:hypothetical protein
MAKCHWCQSNTILLINRVPVCVKCADDFYDGESSERQRNVPSLREMNSERVVRTLRAQLAAAEHHRDSAAKRLSDFLSHTRPQRDEPENPRQQDQPAD